MGGSQGGQGEGAKGGKGGMSEVGTGVHLKEKCWREAKVGMGVICFEN